MFFMRFKYQAYIDRLIAEGYAMPQLKDPNGMEAYRYAFSKANPNNHKPVCVQNPARVLPDNERFSGYALSCFNSRERAEARYSALCKSFKRTPKVIGDALYRGEISNADGMVTEADAKSGHFDLYESVAADLSKTFLFEKLLWNS